MKTIRKLMDKHLVESYMLDGNSRNFLMMDRYYIDSLNYLNSLQI